MTVNREELAWAAGFFSGEGHCGINRTHDKYGHTYQVFRVECSQKDRRVLDRLHAALGRIGTIYQINRTKGNSYYTWQTGKFERAQAVVALIWTWLSDAKREQIRSALTTFHQERAA